MDAADYHQREVPELKARVADALRRDSIPDEVWGLVDADGLVYGAITSGSNEDFQELVSSVREYIKEWNARRPRHNLPPERPKSPPPGEVAIELDDYTEHRALVFSAVSAMLADRRPDVRRFRAEHLAGAETHLTEEQAAKLLYELEPRYYFEDGRPQRDLGFVLTDEIRGNIVELRADLSHVARKLSEAYRWRREDAEWFVLTGTEPRIRPLSVTVNLVDTRDAPSRTATGQITLVAEPWVDANLVADVYRSVQRQLLGGDNRKKNRRTLDAILFVARHLRDSGPVSWEALRRAWNASTQDRARHYKTRHGLYEAFAGFLRPKYKRPRFKPFVPRPWQQHRDARRERARAEAANMAPELREQLDSLAIREPGELHEP